MPCLFRPPRAPDLLRASLPALAATLLTLLSSPYAQAQDRVRESMERGIDPHNNFEPREWQESEAPPPPDFDLRRLVPLDMPHYMSLRFGVDPRTMSVTGDGVVRYVVVAHREGGGTVNAFYEGVRCATGEYKTYARHSGGQWHASAAAPEWKRIDDRNSIYTYQLARQSLCRGRAPRQTVEDMIRELRQPEILRH